MYYKPFICFFPASKGWIKQTYKKVMHTRNHITANDWVYKKVFITISPCINCWMEMFYVLSVYNVINKRIIKFLCNILFSANALYN